MTAGEVMYSVAVVSAQELHILSRFPVQGCMDILGPLWGAHRSYDKARSIFAFFFFKEKCADRSSGVSDETVKSFEMKALWFQLIILLAF